jgi:predicted nucleotidyltransferase
MNQSIRTLVEAGVRFVIIGGHAMQYAGMPRTTIDWDLFIPPHDASNFRTINEALEKDLDMEVVPLGPRGEHFIQSFHTQWAAIQFHLIVAGIASFEEAERLAIEVVDDGVKVRRLCGAHLLATKEKADRPKDQDDLYFLRKLRSMGQLV